MRVEVSKDEQQIVLNDILDAHFPTSETVLVYDDTVSPIIDTITPYTDALANNASLINPKIGYPGQNK